MDKFLAKKNPIFKDVAALVTSGTNGGDRRDTQMANTAAQQTGGDNKQDYVYSGFGLAHPDQTVRYRMNGAILQLSLKSMYENARQGGMVWPNAAFQQL